MENICLVNGSLRGKKASSLQFLEDISRRLPEEGYQKTIITVKARVPQSYPEETLRSLAEAAAIVLVFPLFTYGLPGALMRLLEDYYRYIQTGHSYNRDVRVYMIVNCGFARPVVTAEAVRVIQNFCRRLALNWRFAICIGAGPVVAMTRRVPFLDLKLKKAYAAIASDINSNSKDEKNDFLIKPIVPEPILIRIKNYYEKKGHMIEQ